MKKKLVSGIIGITMLCMCACGEQEASNSKMNKEQVKTLEAEVTESVEISNVIPGNLIPMVMVDGVLYYDTGKESTLEGRCGMMDGEITSSVDASEIPSEDNQSNFGSGFGYQYGINNSIDIQMEDGRWFVFQRQGTEYVEAEANAESAEPLFIRMENPSWEYYTTQTIQCDAKPFGIKVIEETANEIIDTEEWFAEYDLRYGVVNPNEEYHCIAEWGSPIVTVYKGEQCVAELEFTEYMYSPDYVEKDKDYIQEEVHHAMIKDDVLYVSTFHYTYAASAPSNAYITAISLKDYSVIWKSQPLVCNSLNFDIVDDVIFCGYGFTEEDDYLYQLDRMTGSVLDQFKLMSKPDYIIHKDGKLYVRTYNTNYVIEVSR